MCNSVKGHGFPLFGWGLAGLTQKITLKYHKIISCNLGRAPRNIKTSVFLPNNCLIFGK